MSKRSRLLCLLLLLIGMISSPAAVATAGERLVQRPVGDEAGCSALQWVQAAEQLVERELFDQAEAIYRAVLDGRGGEAVDAGCAARGLAVIAIIRADAAAQDKAKVSVPEKVGSSWSAVVKAYATPLGSPLLAGLATLLLLLVLARLATAAAVAPGDVSWSPVWRRVHWGLGMAGLVAAVAVPMVSVSLGGTAALTRPEGLVGLAVVMLLLAVVALSAGVSSDDRDDLQNPAGRMRVRGRSGIPLLGGGLLLGAVLSLTALVPTGVPAVFLTGLAVAVPGVALVATARGQALRLTVDVRAAAGSTDEAAGRYVVSRLSDLGTRPPAGLKIPVLTDVTALPADALTALPEAAAAKALFRVLQALRPGIPWRAVVGFSDAATVTVQLLRNGRSAAPPATITAAKLDPAGIGAAEKDDGAADRQRRRLLVAAAAHILLELSTRHRALRTGLCGATSWRSLAMHAIATGPEPRVGLAQRDSLLAAAVADDPNNFLARAADIGRWGRTADPTDQTSLATAGAAELERLDDAGKGVEPLRLRLRFSIAAATLNVYLLGRRARRDVTARGAAEAVANLVTSIKLEMTRPAEPPLIPLLRGLRLGASFMARTVDHIAPPAELPDTWSETMTAFDPWRPEFDAPLPGGPSYDRACWWATCGPTLPWVGRPWRGAALDDLRVAVADPRAREWARVDPSLESLREGDGECVTRFKALVGDAPPTTLVDLPMFADHRAALLKLGLRDPADVVATPVGVLTEVTGAAPNTARRWKDVADLAMRSGADKAVPIGLLHVVVRCGVTSRAQLRREIAELDAWHARVVQESASIAVVPRKADWAEYARIPGLVALTAPGDGRVVQPGP